MYNTEDIYISRRREGVGVETWRDGEEGWGRDREMRSGTEKRDRQRG